MPWNVRTVTHPITPAEIVKTRRLAKGWTQEELAARCDPPLRREVVNKIENGLSFGPNVGLRLARALRLEDETEEDVFGELVAPPPTTWTERVEALEQELQALRDLLRSLQDGNQETP